MKTINVLTLFILLFISNDLFSQNTDLKLVTINIYESSDLPYSKILIIENGIKAEEIQLGKFHYKELESNQIIINNTLLKYRTAGYKIISSNRASHIILGSIVMVTTYLLEKE